MVVLLRERTGSFVNENLDDEERETFRIPFGALSVRG